MERLGTGKERINRSGVEGEEPCFVGKPYSFPFLPLTFPN